MILENVYNKNKKPSMHNGQLDDTGKWAVVATVGK